jgi:hypothetical protein
MSYTDRNPAHSDLNMVRFLIGDTTTPELLSDAEINGILVSNAVITTAIMCARSLAARYSRMADKSVGDLKISWSQVAKSFSSLAADLSKSPQAIAACAPWAGGTSKAEKVTERADTDRVQPVFTRTFAEPEGDDSASF